MARAFALYEQNLADRQRVLDQDHPGTLKARDELADAYNLESDMARAIALYKQILADCVRVLSEGHPVTEIVRYHLDLARQRRSGFGPGPG